MLKLHEGEKVIIAFHRHWIVVAGQMTMAAMLLLPALVALIIIPAFNLPPELLPLIHYFLTMYLLIVAFVTFVLWFDYYLDVWIVTDERIIDVEQIGMFQREVSEFMLSRIQDVTVEIPGFIATLLRYGNLRIQTAGEQSFVAHDIPHIDKVKNIILTEMRKHHKR